MLLKGPLEKTNEPYAIAKIAGIKLCQSFNKQYKTNAIGFSIDITNEDQVRITSIGARDFLSINIDNVNSYIDDQVVWIATTPTIQLEVLNRIKLQSNRVIIEKPFATNSKELKSFIDLVKDSKNTNIF